MLFTLINVNTNPKSCLNITMMNAPDNCTAYATSPSTTAPRQPDAAAVGPDGASTTNLDITATQVNVAPDSDTKTAVVDDSLAAAGGRASASNSANNATLALKSSVTTHLSPTTTSTSQHSDLASEEHAAASASSGPSLFAKLPGELRNRVYRAYFEDFREEKKKTLDIKKTAPAYLKLLHTDRMIRSEASSIFYKEHFCVDSFIALTENLESAMEWRIESICELVALRDIHMPISITVQEMVPVQVKMLRQLPYEWNDWARSNLFNKLTQFIGTRSREVFLCRTGLQQLGGFRHPMWNHIVHVGSKAYVGPRYRVERVDPDAALSPQQRRARHQHYEQDLQQQRKLAQQELQQNLQRMSSQSQTRQVARPQHPYAGNLQLIVRPTGLQQETREQGLLQRRGAKTATQMCKRPWQETSQERLDQELENFKNAESLCVEGPLAELDWRMFT